ncbi:MAG TPA: hypothetical protein VKG38_00730 [Solirubrobacteraceae bacterium]|nr:hypothetical protein [Solirubrobacteraceae bacterium]
MSICFSIRVKLARSLAAACCLVLWLAVLLPAPAARAALTPASVIDGPSATILDVDGAALAPDGSGGILYRKLVGGEPHLFVARFLGGSWQPPVQVDAGQPFAASFPTIAAGDDGRLLVVWAEPWAEVARGRETLYQLLSSELDPGATQFGPAQQVDPTDVGDGTAAYPSLAMAPDGKAYVAYRVVTDSLLNSPIVPPRAGDEKISVRVARYNGQGVPWTSYGTINNHPEIPMRHPSATNAPVVGVTLNGNAVVVWQEPNSAGVAEIFARRIFAGRLGNALQVSPESVGGRPITAEADAPALAVNGFGEARIAYRLAGGSGSPYGDEQIFLDSLPSELDIKGAKLRGVSPVVGAPALGPPSVAIDEEGNYRLAYGSGGATRLLHGDDFHPSSAPAPLGPGGGAVVRTAINPAGGGTTVWSGAGAAGLPVVDAREDFAGGAWQQAELSAPISGPVGTPVLGGSSQGDALIAFAQGPSGQQQVMAAVAKSPPAQFLATTAIGWVTGGSATVSWEAPAEAFGATTYAVLVDGRVVLRGLTGLSARLDARGLGDGKHRVQVLATDSLGQETMTPVATLKVDANPPEVSVRRFGHGTVQVRVSDRASGAIARDTFIAFGDGTHVSDRLSATHAYARSGRYVIVVQSRDRVGHRRFAHIRVQVQ